MRIIDDRLRVLTQPADLPAAGSPVLAEAYRRLFETGIPTAFLGRRFRTAAVAQLRSDEPNRPMLSFGDRAGFTSMAVDLSSGEVWELYDQPRQHALFVNSSLDQFIATLQAVADRFPFYEADASDTELAEIRGELLGLIGRIDPAAAEPDRYWSSLADDAEMGDLSTSEIEREYGADNRPSDSGSQ